VSIFKEKATKFQEWLKQETVGNTISARVLVLIVFWYFSTNRKVAPLGTVFAAHDTW
jgi:drug/metabolite transporter superfamily protein YnfA